MCSNFLYRKKKLVVQKETKGSRLVFRAWLRSQEGFVDGGPVCPGRRVWLCCHLALRNCCVVEPHLTGGRVWGRVLVCSSHSTFLPLVFLQQPSGVVCVFFTESCVLGMRGVVFFKSFSQNEAVGPAWERRLCQVRLQLDSYQWC